MILTFRAIERMQADEFLGSLLSCHATLACLFHTSNALPTLVRLHWKISASSQAAPVMSILPSSSVNALHDQSNTREKCLQHVAEAIAVLCSGVARAAAAAAGGHDSTYDDHLEDVRVQLGIPGGNSGSAEEEGWRQGKRLLTADVLYFALTRFPQVGMGLLLRAFVLGLFAPFIESAPLFKLVNLATLSANLCFQSIRLILHPWKFPLFSSSCLPHSVDIKSWQGY